MTTLDRDILLGAAIQLIKDIQKVAYAGDRYEFNRDAIISIKDMANGFLNQLEPKDINGKG